MQQLIYFIRKYKFFLLFLFLETIALYLTIQQHLFHSSKFVNSANFVSGRIYNNVHSINEFFTLKSENQRLAEENVQLKNLLAKKKIDHTSVTFQVNDTTRYNQKYEYFFAKVINNNFTKRNNYLTINKGLNQGIEKDFGIITSLGIIGVVDNVSANFATVLSILNKNSRINAHLKNDNHFGTLIWDGKNYNTVQLTDIPRQATIKIGDTIVSGGKSAIFPEGILIGTVKDFKFENNKYHNINISLFNDMSAIGNVQIIKNLQKKEQDSLELQTPNE